MGAETTLLDAFLPETRDWFQGAYPALTPPQELGWPPILRGENVLILSPTGSGKTMAAFLCAIDRIYRLLLQDADLPGVQTLYISPLKALNNDIERNLRVPLAGIRRVAREGGSGDWPHLRVAVRTGDTPQSARRSMVAHPPHVLITTPESLYLILSSRVASAMLANVREVIVDEIHTLVGNKRGVHLALSLERLGQVARQPFQRIGLSATQRPLEEVARFLVGQEWSAEEPGGPENRLVSRPVTIIDAGLHRDMDLQVVTVPEDMRNLVGGSIWPSVIPHVLNEVRRHRTTLIFANARRGAERAADRLNEQYAAEEAEEVEPGSPAPQLADGVVRAMGMFGTGRVGGPFRAHHGSVSREVRLELERALKAGELPALVGTSSLELGIDIGAIDAVVQLQSPHSVSAGLQRVGRSGHLVGQTSVGRIYATYPEDLLDAAAVAHGMMHGDIEPTWTPRNCLDVLAQQVVAMVSMADWSVPALYRTVRQAYGYGDLSREALDAVLEMLSGSFPSEAFRELRPRLMWDRVNDNLAALPGSSLLAIRNGGTIPDRGLFSVVLSDGKTRLGTLDEEFVYESKPGDVFALGSNTWRVLQIDEDKVVVGEAAGSMPRMPFWRGEAPKREYYLGQRLGEFRRQLAERVASLPPLPEGCPAAYPAEAEAVCEWLRNEYAMDTHSARNAIAYVRRQLDAVGVISTDRTVVVETFSDALGDQRLVIHSCFGGRVNSAWALALSHAIRERYRLNVETQVNDDGILMRLVQADRDLPIDIVVGLSADEARQRVLLELPDSALFGSQFRMNAARALLLPGARGTRRTPFWLQRLRARDLLAAAKQFRDFPIVAETYRDCLRDVLDLEHLTEVLAGVRRGDIRVVEIETVAPSPVAASLLFDFVAVEMYEGDLPKIERQMRVLAINRELLAQLLADGSLPDLLRPEAVAAVEAELQHVADGYRARSREELAWLFQELGDLSAEEVSARSAGDGRAWLLELAAQGRVVECDLPTAKGPVRRWVSVERIDRYRKALNLPDGERMPQLTLPSPVEAESPDEAREALLRQALRASTPRSLAEIGARHAFPVGWLAAALQGLVDEGSVVRGYLTPGAVDAQWCDRAVLERIHRRTLSILRHEIEPVDRAALADFSVRWQGLHPAHKRAGLEGLTHALQQLRGASLPAVVWARDVLPGRVDGLTPARLNDLAAEGELAWVASGSGDARRARARLFFRGEGALFMADAADLPADTTNVARQVADFLRQEGASTTHDLRAYLGLSATDLQAALRELVLAGLVTNDRYEVLDVLTAGELGPQEEHAVTSSLDAHLEAWRRGRRPAAILRRPPPSALRRASRVATRRAEPPADWPGHWMLTRGLAVRGKVLGAEDRAERLARVLLQRYGIVTRACLALEDLPLDWVGLSPILQRMELRGEVRRGYFSRGLPGLQYALPEAVDALREWNRSDAEGRTAPVVLNACDPANVYAWDLAPSANPAGGESPEPSAPPTLGSGLARVASNYLVVSAGVAVLTYEHGSGAWSGASGVGEDTLLAALAACLRHLTREGGLCASPPRVTVRTWNGEPPVGSGAQAFLERAGLRRDTPSMVWEPRTTPQERRRGT